jgi:eukaryotic-like serine/threonine-protein kinase
VSRGEAAALLKLAESIADGSPIDWDVAEATASQDDQAVIRQLRVLSNLAGLHRTLHESIGGAGGSSIRRDSGAPAIGNWAHLTLIERLGGGTFGDVYRAWDRHLERQVALKLLRVESEGDAGDLSNSRIAREGRLLARIRHQNVIAVHGVDAHDNRVGLWMDLIRGVTLEEQLAAHGPFSATEAAAIGIDLCRALASIHSAGLIHRDVKAQNVMREEGGRIVLMDLGTGREADRVLAGGVPELAGTPLYLAPEIFLGSPASPKTDVYSLGVLLYHLVTGTFPVKAATIDQLQQAHANGEVARLRDARADLPTAFVRVVDRAIAPEPAKRHQSAGELEADLADAVGRPAADEEGRPRSRFRALTGWPAAAFAAAAAAIVIGALALPWPPPFLRTHIGSIAVLPLTNLSGDASQEYFADGMTDLLIGDLARIHSLRVISRTSAMQYKGTSKSLQEIARALNVDAVLEGTVQRTGNRVRISADLVQASSDRHLWSDTYERDVKDVFALQNEVAQAIARQVQIKLTPQEQAGFTAAAAVRQVDPSAQDAYLQGRYFWNKRTSDGLQRALDYFHQAASLDPTFALAYVGQADAYDLLPGSMMPAVAYPQAKAAAARALELDPSLGEAYTSLAFASFIFDRDWTAAERSFARAIQLNPNYATAHHWYAEYLSAMGRLDDAIAEFDKAKALDPLSTGIRTSLGSTYYLARRYDDGIAELRASLDLDSSVSGTYLYLGMCYEGKQDFAAAAAEAQRGLELEPNDTKLQAQLGRIAAREGRRDDALAAIAKLQASQSRVNQDDIASIYASLGDADRAFDYLRRAGQDKSPGLLWSRFEEHFDAIRSDSRFSAFFQGMGLP